MARRFHQERLYSRCPALRGGTVTGVVDEDAARDLCGDGQEVSPVLPAHPTLANKPQVGFIDKGGGLQRMPWFFAADVAVGESVQPFLNQGE
jgi:hypothetical protein